MHKHYTTDETRDAPAAVQRAKNLIEEFFGLPVADGAFMSAKELPTGIGAGNDHYHCNLVSPTGRALSSISLSVRPSDGWVTIRGDKGFEWAEALQVAIDNFINNPKGGGQVLGDWKPTPEKLEVERADPPQAPFSLD